MRSGNLLDKEPEGLGKHMSVYAGQRHEFNEVDVTASIARGELPYFVETPTTTFYIEIGSDLVLEELDFSNTDQVIEKHHALLVYKEQAYAYVGIRHPYTEMLVIFDKENDK